MTVIRTPGLIDVNRGALKPQKGFMISMCLFLGSFFTSTIGSVTTDFAAPVKDTHHPVDVQVRMFPSEAAVARISRGGYGQAYLVYYLPQRGPNHPSLVVRLEHSKASRYAYADVYQAGGGKPYVVYHFVHGHATFAKDEQPAMVMTAVDGKWILDGHPDLNLNIRIFSPFRAMWEVVPIRTLMGYGNPKAKHTRQVIYTILTRTYPDGVPHWDLRELGPALPGEGVYRTNYAQRENDSPLQWAQSISPQWPYVALTGTFLQNYGTETPPIVVDWKTGKIKDFSEVTSVRAESRGYAMYSLIKMPLGQFGEPDFESPWGFYNLSGRTSNYPNLVIRLQHNTANDPYYTSYTPATQFAPLYPFQSEDVRYSWADHPGNLMFNYKIDVAGNVPYTQKTSLAGGRLSVLAPDYRSFPNWVLGHQWPVVSFVDTEGNSYATTEGIYDAPAVSIGIPYLRGWTSTPSLSGFSGVTTGFREEYRYGVPSKVLLYMSPFDERWHLMNADGGIWNLLNGDTVREKNLTNGSSIDMWQLANKKGMVTQDFAHIDGWTLYSGPLGAAWTRDARRSIGLVTSPPSNHSTWEHFVRVNSQHKPRSPIRMQSWLPADTSLVRGLAISGLKADAAGFHFILTVDHSNHKAKVSLPSLGRVSAGRYLVTYDVQKSKWSLHEATRAVPKITVSGVPGVVSSLMPTTLGVLVQNVGDLPLVGRIEVSISGKSLLATKIRVAGGSELRKHVSWVPNQTGNMFVQVRFDGNVWKTIRFRVESQLRMRTQAVESTLLPLHPDEYAAMASLLLMFAVVMVSWRRLRQ